MVSSNLYPGDMTLVTSFDLSAALSHPCYDTAATSSFTSVAFSYSDRIDISTPKTVSLVYQYPNDWTSRVFAILRCTGEYELSLSQLARAGSSILVFTDKDIKHRYQGTRLAEPI